jgi:soluble lytic murein transglycosylase-like protein
MTPRHLAILAVAAILGGTTLAQPASPRAFAPAPEPWRVHRAILRYIADRNPQAPLRAFLGFPALLLAEARQAGVDHCLLLAQADVESGFRHDALGRAGEIGLFQLLPSTAALFERRLGPFRRPQTSRRQRDLGDLADPATNTRFAVAYLSDILDRRRSLTEALSEYNSGPGGQSLPYARAVLAAYAELLTRADLACTRDPAPRLTRRLHPEPTAAPAADAQHWTMRS